MLILLLAIIFCINISGFTVKATDKTIAEEYSELYEYACELQEDDYTEESWSSFNEVWETLMTVSNINVMNESAQEILLAKLQGAINGLVEKTIAEKYSELHEYAATLKEADYTNESWAEFSEVWKVLSSVSDISIMNESAQETLLAKLQNAINGLKENAELTTAEKYVELHEYASTLKEDDYTEETWKGFSEVWKTLSTVSDISVMNESAQEILLAKLQNAIDGLQKNNEQTIIEQYVELYDMATGLTEADYTADSWTVFMSTWGSLSKISDITGYTEAEQLDYLSKLQEAISGLVVAEAVDPESNYAKLLARVSEIESYQESDYSSESWKEFQTGMEKIYSYYLPMAEQDYEEKGDINYTWYNNQLESVLKVLYRADTETVTITHEETGIQVISNNYDIVENAWLDVVVYDETNWPYTREGAWTTNIATTSYLYKAYNITVKDAEGNAADIARKYEITVPISEEFDIENININIAQKSGAKYAPTYEIDEENRLLVISISNIYTSVSNGITVFLSNQVETIDTATLADGVYTVKANLVKYSDQAVSSMADGTLVEEAVLVKSGDEVDVYLSFVPLDYLGGDSYTGGLWCEVGEKADGQVDEDSMTVLSYYCNEDGTLMDNEIYDAITEIACIKQIKLRLNDECKNENNGYILAVSSPAMATMNDLSYEEIIVDDLLVTLLLSDAEYIGTEEIAKDSIPEYDKSALMKEIQYAGIFSTDEYTEESYQKLVEAIKAAKDVYKEEYTSSSEASAAYVEQIALLQSAVDGLKEKDSLTAAKEALLQTINAAKAVEQGSKTDSAYENLQSAISTAENVLNNISANVNSLTEAKTVLEKAVADFNSSDEASDLDYLALEDGEYKVYVDMKKVDKTTDSMSNNAIEHWVNLTVKDGTYTVTVDFNGMTISGQYGYLSALKYYEAGYSYSSTGEPVGTLANATVLSTQKNTDGSDVIDSFNDAENLYPDTISFPLVDKGTEEYVPLQVYVPIMESITAGTGTQNVLMKIDWTSLRSADDDTQDVINLEDGLYTVTSQIRESGSDEESSFDEYLDKVRLIVNEGKITAYIDFKSLEDGDSEKYVNGITVINNEGEEIFTAGTTDKMERVEVVLPENVELTKVKLKDSTGQEMEGRLYLALRSAAVQTADKTTLAEYIRQAEEIQKDGKTYTENSVVTLKEALEAATIIYEDDVAIANEISAAGLALKNAISTMEEEVTEEVDKSALEDVLAKAEEISNDNGKYTDESFENLTKALENARTVYDNADVAQADVDSQTKLLQAAIDALTEKAVTDKTALSDMIKAAEALNDTKDNYTAESWNALAEAYSAAVKVNENANADQNEIDNQTQLLQAAINALVTKTTATLADGVYQITGEIVNATDPTKLSMANGALEYATDENGNKTTNPLYLIVKDGKAYIRMRFVSLTIDNLTGYLGELKYYPNYENTDALPGADEELADVTVEYAYQGYDQYNDPDFGTDSYMKGKAYPEQVSFPVEIGDTEIWLQVYVPVMEAISSGSGTQQARLLLDWSENSLKQIRDESIVITELEKQIEYAKSMEQGNASEATWNALQTAISSAQAVYDNLSSTQEQIDAQILFLQKAMAAVQNENGAKSDKTQLQTSIANAKEKLAAADTYTESSLKTLQTILAYAESVYADQNAEQTTVDAAVTALNGAIEDLKELEEQVDTTALEAEIANAEELAAQTDVYTEESIQTLQIAINNAKRVLASEDKTQDSVTKQVTALQNAEKALIKKTIVDKSSLEAQISEAKKYLDSESAYTSATIAALKTAISNAQAVYEDSTASQASVDMQITALQNAISALVKAEDSTLDITKLSDGVYSLTGTMVKTDKSTLSMSNNAINHTIKLTVKDGKYYITLNFNGLTVGSRLGYLSQLKYYLTGYTTDSYGNPQGTLAVVTVDSYQTTSDGTLVSDSYGSNYPDEVTFELIPEAMEDGYVPLQVFVPIMEAISSGTGTQPVYLKLDWSTLKLTTDDDGAFDDDSNNSGNDSGTDNNGNNSNTNNSGNTNSGTLSSGTLGTNTLSGSTLGTSSLSSGTSSLSSGTSGLSSSGLSSGTSSLSSASSVKTSDTQDDISAWQAVLAFGGMILLVGLMERKKKNETK